MKIKRIRPELLYEESVLHIYFDKGQNKDIGQLLERIGGINQEKDYDVIIKPIKVKRSLDANAYLWVLCDKLAKKMSAVEKKTYTKKDIYREAIKDIGVFDTMLLVDKAVDGFIKKWNSNGDGYVAEVSHKSNINGCTAVRAYYGSHTYNTKEMARLIDYIVEQCKEQGIETRTPNEIEEMKQKWGVG